MSIKIAVLTLVKGRNEALLNLIKGLSANLFAEFELIIVHMNERTCLIPPCPFPVLSFGYHSTEQLPLAKARNFAVSKTNARHCIFLDVDCIPSASFMQSYAAAFNRGDKLWSGQVRYLNEKFSSETKAADFDACSLPDPIRGGLTNIPYELFWSLNFGCSRSVFETIGGFDENYMGYGAEDTDFSFTARTKEIELTTVDAIAYHQPHASYDPPLNHLEDIISNARVFYHKWGRWPMEGWLKKFAELGYISWSNNELVLLSYPAQSAIDLYLKSPS
ncbi:glycosyltransferase family 2 protein [Pedobacter hartonius]|uniref:Glycosyltransferase, GT2 family n=1 Tax=Pedobacter hartonius TaxID=425514 RepID=A0A1H4GLS8_9SPHI|nr:galactosyltransferase-related protein [Pedobacter hartonius]SEB09818.1 Glycosyltransferase, GT2 family [Pedobacter hartonius]